MNHRDIEMELYLTRIAFKKQFPFMEYVGNESFAHYLNMLLPEEKIGSGFHWDDWLEYADAYNVPGKEDFVLYMLHKGYSYLEINAALGASTNYIAALSKDKYKNYYELPAASQFAPYYPRIINMWETLKARGVYLFGRVKNRQT